MSEVGRETSAAERGEASSLSGRRRAERARRLIAVGAGLAALGVGAGAFGAHGLEASVTPDRLDTFETAARYHLIHAVALVMVGAVGLFASLPDASDALGRRLPLVGYLFFGGVVLFSGSLYLLVLTDTPWLGAITPLGGLCFISGWLVLSVTAWQSIGRNRSTE